MSEREISQQELDELIEDASYLQDEAEALQYVIDTVPYNDRPPDGRSIAELLLLIDHAQRSYYKEVMVEAWKNPRPTHLKNFIHYRDSFEADEDKLQDVQKILSRISKHRAGFVNTVKKIPLIDWETVIYRNDNELLLFDFLREMIRFERGVLKEIAELVKAYKDEKHSQREIEKRRTSQEGPHSAENS